MSVSQPILDAEIAVPEADQSPSERFEAICRAISAASAVQVQGAPPMRFDAAFSDQPSAHWPAERGKARKIVLNFLASAARPCFYHLYCEPLTGDSRGFCALNLSRQMVEFENQDGIRVVGFMP